MPEIVIGIIVSLLVYELTKYSPGGIITAGYFALYSNHWQFIAGTILVGLATWGVVNILSNYVVLYGKRLFAVYLLTGLLISQGVPLMLNLSTNNIEFATIGYLLPGLIAKDADHQGWSPTLATLLLSVGVIRMVIFAGRGVIW